MNAETAQMFQALEAQAHTLLKRFSDAGYEMVAPSIIQPADVFLDVVGENLRGRTYVFTDRDGSELCLRPDLTVPTCRLHWERFGKEDVVGKYCYNGPAFRFQPGGGTGVHPREFRQAGIESFGEKNRERTDAEVLALVLSTLEEVGITDYTVRIGDLGLFHALLDGLDMPAGWRSRLKSRFWRPAAFQAEVEQLASRPLAAIDGLPDQVVTNIRSAKDVAEAEQMLLAYFELRDIEVIGVRTPREVAANLMSLVADAQAEPLSDTNVALLASYLSVNAPARAAGARLQDLMDGKQVNMERAFGDYHRRLQSFSQAGIDLSRLNFSALFGRNLQYYTGFVFEVPVPQLDAKSPIAGGGRYDRLLLVGGAGSPVPAVGAMIHTERLLAAVQGETG